MKEGPQPSAWCCASIPESFSDDNILAALWRPRLRSRRSKEYGEGAAIKLLLGLAFVSMEVLVELTGVSHRKIKAG